MNEEIIKSEEEIKEEQLEEALVIDESEDTIDTSVTEKYDASAI